MLETIREYAGERLAGKGDTRERGLRHAEFFLALADEARTHLETQKEAEWLGRIEVEHDNVRTALSCLEAADAERFIRLAVDVWRFWLLRGHFAEGREWLRRALDLNPEPSLQRWAALQGAASLIYFPEGHRGMRPLAEETLEVAQQIGDRASMADSLHLLGQLEAAEGNADAAIDLFQRSLTYQDHPQLGFTYHALGHVRLLEDDYEGALEWLKQAEALNRAQGKEYEVAQDLISRAYALHGLGRDDEATSLLRQSLELLRPLKDVRVSTNCFDALSATLAAYKPEIAATLMSAAEVLREDGGVAAGSLSQRWNPVTWETLRAPLSERSLARSIVRGRAMDLETAVAFGLASTDRGGTGLENQ
jgi:non-specific serine/threonine protein kinase